MTREQIEKAANIYMLPYYSDEEYLCGIKDIQSGFIDAFSRGAQWRINSVWHKPSEYGEELKMDVGVIAKTKRGYRFGQFGVVGLSNEYIGFVSTSSFEYALSDVLEYAYLDDLIPGSGMCYDMDMCDGMTHDNGYCPLRDKCKRFILGQKALMEDYYPIYWTEPCYEDGKCELFIEVKEETK